MRLSQLLQFQKTFFESILFKISVRKFWIQNNSFPQLCAYENGINNIDLQLIGRHQSTSRKPHQSGALFASVRSIPKEQWYRQAYFFSPLPSPLSYFRPSTYPKGCYFYPPQLPLQRWRLQQYEHKQAFALPKYACNLQAKKFHAYI